MSTTDTQAEQQVEIERLRARVAELEAELIRIEDWANRSLGEAQERLYWLDRWHLDLNELMQRPGAAEFRAAIRAARAVIRFLRRLRGRLSSV
jgi:hypothetical protein